MDCFISLMTPIETWNYQMIPAYYADLRKEDCVIAGAWDSAEQENLLGVIIIARHIMDPAFASVRFVWFSEDTDEEKLYDACMQRLRGYLRHAGVTDLVFWSLSMDGRPEGFVTPERMKALSYPEEPSSAIGIGWAIDSIYDTPFYAYRAMEEQLNENIFSFSDFSREKSRILLRKLGVPEDAGIFGPSLESPYSRIWMDGKKPLCAMTVEIPYADTALISGAYFPSKEKHQAVFESLAASAFGLSLSGMGMDARILVRFREKGQIRILEDQLGEAEFDVEYRVFVYHIG